MIAGRLMDSRDYVGPTAVQAAVLPARAVYLVADGSEGGLRRAVQEACTRWGGMTEPVVPVKPGGEIDPWWQQVSRPPARTARLTWTPILTTRQGGRDARPGLGPPGRY